MFINSQVLPNDMLDFLDAPVPYIVSGQMLAYVSLAVTNSDNLVYAC